jgi:hypothetical protein
MPLNSYLYSMSSLSKNRTQAFRCDLHDFLLDLLDFIEQQIEQAMSDPADQRTAVDAARGVIPLIRRRLATDQEPEARALWAYFVLAPGSKFEDRFWRKAWNDLATMPREEFREAGRVLMDTVESLRQVINNRLGY